MRWDEVLSGHGAGLKLGAPSAGGRDLDEFAHIARLPAH